MRRDIRNPFLSCLSRERCRLRRGGRRWQFPGCRRGGAVLFLPRFEDLVAIHGNLGGCVDADPDGRARDLQQRDGDVVADLDTVAGLARDHQHVPSYLAWAATGTRGVVAWTSPSSTSPKRGSRTAYPCASLMI